VLAERRGSPVEERGNDIVLSVVQIVQAPRG
jgi:hypothetical protein